MPVVKINITLSRICRGINQDARIVEWFPVPRKCIASIPELELNTLLHPSFFLIGETKN